VLLHAMKTGKLPHDILARLLKEAAAPDPRVLVGPAVGEDAAVIDMGDRVLVAKTDPITFATDLIGWYAVHVNANDVACMGAHPAWFMATVLLPDGASEDMAEEIFGQIRDACAALGTTLVGGHTEVSVGLERPIVVGALLAEARREEIVRSDGARPGDCLLLTKGIALEGTALLAREAPHRLREAGIDEATLGRARCLLLEPGISVVREALLACRVGHVHAMHDPTEGGLATALYELTMASGLGARIHLEDVQVLPETAALCEALGLDPLGLLASGSLLIAVGPEDCDDVLKTLGAEGIPVACIGNLVPVGEGVIMDKRGTGSPLPRFERDELARFFEEAGEAATRP
jgi:hydrogenase expression/formation protein HypE